MSYGQGNKTVVPFGEGNAILVVIIGFQRFVSLVGLEFFLDLQGLHINEGPKLFWHPWPAH